MDNFVRNSTRKPAVVAPKAQPAQAVATPPTPVKKAPKSKLFHAIVIGLLVLVVLVVGWLYMQNQAPAPMSDRYQAIFLDDGKVFFGRLDGIGGDYLTLDEAYYTQTRSTSSDGETELQPTSGVNLVKVGDEIYGPENSMVIRADKVLFWQNLTTDNQIVKAIENQQD